MSYKILSAVAVLLMATLAGAASLQPKPSESAVEATAPTLEKRLEDARATLARFRPPEADLPNIPAGVSLQEVSLRRALQSRLVRLLEQQISNAAEVETAKARRQEFTRTAESWSRFSEAPPYSILLPDQLREEIQTEQIRATSAEAALKILDQMMADNREELARTEEKLRLITEQLEEAKNQEIVKRLTWKRELEGLRSQVALASVGVLDSERQLRTETAAESRVRLALLQRQLVLADAGARFSQADLDTAIGRIEKDRLQLEGELTQAEARLESASQAAAKSRADLSRAQQAPQPVPDEVARVSQEVAAQEAQVESIQGSIRILRLLLEMDSVERTMWEMRFAAVGSHSVPKLSESRHRLALFTRRLSLWRDYQTQQRQISPSQIELQETRVQGLTPDSPLVPLAQERLVALRERDQLLQRLIRRLDQVQRLSERWAESLRAAEEGLPFFGRLRSLFSDAGSFLQKLWEFELLTAEDTITVEGQRITGKRSITLGKIVLAVLILGAGIWITGVLTRFCEPIIIRRLSIDSNQARLIRRWLRAFLVVCLVVFSLVSVKIPLTVFAFAGGALAIGLGFGMQNLLKNFVSGLILLFERPFRVGDVLEVSDNRGTVTEIGLRASVLQLWDGTETLIPNSSLLENNVSNWTYSSRKVRFNVAVGAAYGSDTRRVLQLLREVIDRHGVVEKDPPPQVLFTDFGDSALIFEVRYWVDVIKANPAQVGSDLRQMIVGTFAENGIAIAFPQRDLHLDSVRPLQVTLLAASASGQAPGRKDGEEQRPPAPLGL